MRIRVFVSFFTLALNLLGTTCCRGDDYKLSIDMNASQKQIVTREVVQTRAPASVSSVAVYAVGFHEDRVLFPKDYPRETNRTYRAQRPVGFENSVSGTPLMFSVYMVPFARKYTAPFGDTPSQVTERSLHAAGFAFAYLF